MYPVIFNRPNADFTPIRTRDHANNVVVVPAPVNVFKAVSREIVAQPVYRKANVKPLAIPRRRGR